LIYEKFENDEFYNSSKETSEFERLFYEELLEIVG